MAGSIPCCFDKYPSISKLLYFCNLVCDFLPCQLSGGKILITYKKKHCFYVVLTISKKDKILHAALYFGHLFELQCTSLVLLQAMSYPAQYQPDVVVCNSCICSILLYWGKRILPFVLYQKVVGLAACTRCLVAAVVLYIYT